MVEINLLPWREEERRYQRKQIGMILLLALVVSIVPMLGIYINLLGQEKEWSARVASLRGQAERYPVTLRTSLSKKTITMPFLQQHNKNKKLFDSLASTKADKLCFNKMVRIKQKIFFSGHAHSALDLTHFLLNWQALALFSEVKIEHMEKQKDHLYFQLQAV